MGDRYTVGFTGFDEADNEERRIWLYSHWGGSDRHAEIARAIDAAKPRWSDPTYATRIAISNIVGEQWKNETGFGIEAGPRCLTSVEYGAILVDWFAKTVTEYAYLRGEELGEVVNEWPLDGFLSQYMVTV